MNVNRGVGASFFKVALIAVVMSLFAVSCGGGDDDVQVESRVKNAAPEASAVSSAVSGALSEAVLTAPDCNTLVTLVLIDLISVSNFFLTGPASGGVVSEFFQSNNIRTVSNYRDYLTLDKDIVLHVEDEKAGYSRAEASALIDKLDRLDGFNYVGFDLLDLINVILGNDAAFSDFDRDRFFLAYTTMLNRLDSSIGALLDQCDAASKSGNYAPEGDDVDGG